MYNIFIVEDHPVIRQSYALVLKRETDMTICGEASSAEDALAMIPGCAPDIVLIDVSLPKMSGLELVQRLQEEQPGLPTVVISGHREAVFIEGVLAAGAAHYIVKEQAAQQLVAAIRQLVSK
ncbi:MAG: response regulator transcription factor [Caldilineaceae bacterium]